MSEKLLKIFSITDFTIPVEAGSPKYLILTNNPKNPPPPHEKVRNYIEFNDKARMVVWGYSLGGGGLSRLFVMWPELLANPPLQI